MLNSPSYKLVPVDFTFKNLNRKIAIIYDKKYTGSGRIERKSISNVSFCLGFRWFFGTFEDTKKSFRNQLTFSDLEKLFEICKSFEITKSIQIVKV